uniref:Translation elongation factor EF1B beta/delta subunit guanine nucleotide exchange domain-containing protein n=1 Tax=Globodera rostochiensis TaxID=31243 RepID=A0A914HL38_GLORO
MGGRGPWDDTIDIKDIEEKVRFIKGDGLVWGASKILPVAFGVQKLQVDVQTGRCVVGWTRTLRRCAEKLPMCAEWRHSTS